MRGRAGDGGVIKGSSGDNVIRSKRYKGGDGYFFSDRELADTIDGPSVEVMQASCCEGRG